MFATNAYTLYRIMITNGVPALPLAYQILDGFFGLQKVESVILLFTGIEACYLSASNPPFRSGCISDLDHEGKVDDTCNSSKWAWCYIEQPA